MANVISNLGTIPTLTVGGRVFTDLTNLIVICAPLSTTGVYSTLRQPNGSSGYQVPSGKTLRIWACKFWPGNAGTAALFDLLYGDTDVGLNSASAPTNAVGVAGQTTNVGMLGIATTAGTVVELSVDFTVPALKYAAWSDGGSSPNGVLWAYGYLE